MKYLLFIFFLLSTLYVSGQIPGTEILLFDLRTRDGQVVISGGTNFTNHKGYDNQPHFDPDRPVIYYSSFNDSGRSDIRYFDMITKRTANLTITNEREYSPTVTPDGKFISCIIQRDNGNQDLGKYPINGGSPIVLINDLKVGYHAWAGRDELLLYVLGDSNTNTLHYYNLADRTDMILAKNIGRSLHKIPGQNGMSFIQRAGEKRMISRFDLASNAITQITFTIEGKDDLTWLQNDILLMSDGTGLFSFQVGKDATWKPVIVEGKSSLLKGISRLAVDRSSSKLAVVVAE